MSKRRDKQLKYGEDTFARFPKFSFSMIPHELINCLSVKGVGRNAWAVIGCLCNTIYHDGRIRTMSSEEISKITGLNSYQIARGMSELRNKGIIEPVIRTTAQGYQHKDRSTYGHVAQYRFTSEVWKSIELDFSKEEE